MDSTDGKTDAANDAQYGVEGLWAGWNPLAAANVRSAEPARESVSDSVVEIQAFLTRFYRFQQG